MHKEQKKAEPQIVPPKLATDSNYLQNHFQMREPEAKETVKYIEKAQSDTVKPNSVIVVQSPSPQQAATQIRERIIEKDQTLPPAALAKSDKTIVSEQPKNKDYQVGVYKINTYRNWAIGIGVGKVDNKTYIPIVISRQYAQTKSLDLQINYDINKHRVDGFQVVHKWHF